MKELEEKLQYRFRDPSLLRTALTHSSYINEHSREQAVCVIQSTKVYVTPFCEVSADHAFWEGEGDRSLAYWRQVHERFFSEELKTIGKVFNASMKVVCEEFVKVFPF